MSKYLNKLFSLIHNPKLISASFKGLPRCLKKIWKGGPLVLVLLVAILFLCNEILFHNTTGHSHRDSKIPIHDTELWNTTKQKNNSFVISNQRVHGLGWKGIPNPIPIPIHTVLFGSDQTFNQNWQQHNISEKNRRFMTIGISSVWRKENYLYRTIDALIDGTSEKEKLDFYVYLLLADKDPQFRYERAKAIENHYRQHIESGMLLILQSPSSLYHSIDFSKIKKSYNDSVERVQWRTKQVLDFAFLFHYTWTRDPSLYFLILEDDILSAKHFVSATKKFVKKYKNHPWVALQLAGFLAIGQLIRCRDLDRLASFLLQFYTEHPVDILIDYWVSLMNTEKHVKDKPTIRFPSLFQHIGIHSTLANKKQLFNDQTFSIDNRLFNHYNPPANLVTTMNQHETFAPEQAYGILNGLFWGKSKPNDTFDIVFSQPLHLSRLFINTGTYVRNSQMVSWMTSKLLFGHVEVSSEFQRMETPKKAACTKFEFLKSFKNGEVDFEGFPKMFPLGVQCIRIIGDPPQKEWVAISEIAVFTVDEANLETD